tara:strand:+ start:636 stop:1004 length:369 start_codon:yes stop_codon:yes gene_type:complete
MKHRSQLSPGMAFANRVTDRVGTLHFFGLIVLWSTFWLTWNSFAPESLVFDRGPDFLLWLLISNMIQLMLMPLLLIGQNLQGGRMEKLERHNVDVSVKAEKEIRDLHRKVDELTALLRTSGR